MDTNAILTLLIIPAAAALVGAIKVLWSVISGFVAKLNKDLDECKEDRTKLFGEVKDLNNKHAEVIESLGEMRGRLNMVQK